MTCASELFLWSGSCPSSTTNHLKREDSNPHKSQQLYWLSHVIYDKRRDLDSKHHPQQGISENAALNQHHERYLPLQKYSLDRLIPAQRAFIIIFGFLSKRAWRSCYSTRWRVGSSEGQPAGWCNVCRNQDGGHDGEVRHEEWNTGKVVLRQLNQSQGLMLTVAGALQITLSVDWLSWDEHVLVFWRPYFVFYRRD